MLLLANDRGNAEPSHSLGEWSGHSRRIALISIKSRTSFKAQEKRACDRRRLFEGRLSDAISSSGVWDGVQARVAALDPEVVSIAVEATGDGAASLHSRLRMAVFKGQ